MLLEYVLNFILIKYCIYIENLVYRSVKFFEHLWTQFIKSSDLHITQKSGHDHLHKNIYRNVALKTACLTSWEIIYEIIVKKKKGYDVPRTPK